ncbi:MAG: hypothetical protein ACR2NU_16960 [Aeoliella sp.]
MTHKMRIVIIAWGRDRKSRRSTDSRSEGVAWNNYATVFGESREGLTCCYLEPGRTVPIVGILEYTRSHNTLVLIVNPTTGEAPVGH